MTGAARPTHHQSTARHRQMPAMGLRIVVSGEPRCVWARYPELQEPQLEALELPGGRGAGGAPASTTTRSNAACRGRALSNISRAFAFNCRRSCPEGALFRAVALGLQRSWAAPPMINPKRGRPPAEIHWKAEQAWTICG